MEVSGLDSHPRDLLERVKGVLLFVVRRHRRWKDQTDIPVRHDADEFSVLDHRQVSDLSLPEQLQGSPHAIRRADPDHRRPHPLGHLHLALLTSIRWYCLPRTTLNAIFPA